MTTRTVHKLAGLLVAAAMSPDGFGQGDVVLANPRSSVVSSGSRDGEGAPEAWLGISVDKASPEVYSLLNDVPQGVGFLIDGVPDDGPAYAAGIRRHDFLWKFEDQLLVNEAQMVVLLSHREVGETVRLTYQRKGRNYQTDVELAARPEHEKGRARADEQVLAQHNPRLPRQIVNLERRTAEISDEIGTVRIERAGEQYGWEERDVAGRLLRQGLIAGSAEDDFPEEMAAGLENKLRVLIRAFEFAEERASRPRSRPRRIRRIPMHGDDGG